MIGEKSLTTWNENMTKYKMSFLTLQENNLKQTKMASTKKQSSQSSEMA